MDRKSISVRKIENGYVTTTCNGEDDWRGRETFHAEKPTIEMGLKDRGGPKGNSLKGAVKAIPKT